MFASQAGDWRAVKEINKMTSEAKNNKYKRPLHSESGQGV